jgi:hypothetical protein
MDKFSPLHTEASSPSSAGRSVSNNMTSNTEVRVDNDRLDSGGTDQTRTDASIPRPCNACSEPVTGLLTISFPYAYA